MAAVAMMTTGLCADRRESRERVRHHATAVMYRDIGLCARAPCLTLSTVVRKDAVPALVRSAGG